MRKARLHTYVPEEQVAIFADCVALPPRGARGGWGCGWGHGGLDAREPVGTPSGCARGLGGMGGGLAGWTLGSP